MRLIDADKLVDYFYYGIDDKPIIDGISDRKIIDIIKNQPTAYDVDKVVEQLEELKELRETSCGYSKEDIELNRTAMYNKAIDDFVRFANTMPTVESEDGTIRPMWLEEIAEQLKEQK